jgi:hypothetical protein
MKRDILGAQWQRIAVSKGSTRVRVFPARSGELASEVSFFIKNYNMDRVQKKKVM